jgi:3-phosphoshikimate 1-carboxyvinyltransferase
MKVKIEKSEVKGSVSTPTSKSLTIRGLMCAALAKGESQIINPLVCEDTSAAIKVLKQIGMRIQEESGMWRVTGGSFRVPNAELFCGESATTLRFMTAIASLIPGRHKLTGGPSLTQRPARSLVEALAKLGVRGTTEGKTTPPVIINGGTFQGGLTELPGNISSQFVSALLLIAPFSRKGTQVRLTTQLTSRSYVLMTLRCLRQFGINVSTEFDKFIVRRQRYRPARLEIEGDWSSASYFLALGAASDGITVEKVTTASLQGDRVILEFLRNMGAAVRVGADSATVSRGELKAIRADLSDCIDLLPTVAVLAALAEGVSELTGIQRARIKESNRVAAVKEGLEKVGIPVAEDRDRLTITGVRETVPALLREEEEEEAPAGEGEPKPKNPLREPERKFKPAVINSRGDHRIAMAFGILGAIVGDITIEGAECVAKTYPGFWETLKSVGGKVTSVE